MEERGPNPAAELSAWNWQAYEHYCECKAVGQFPDDAIVRRNAGLIRMVEDSVARNEFQEGIIMLARMFRGHTRG